MLNDFCILYCSSKIQFLKSLYRILWQDSRCFSSYIFDIWTNFSSSKYYKVLARITEIQDWMWFLHRQVCHFYVCIVLFFADESSFPFIILMWGKKSFEKFISQNILFFREEKQEAEDEANESIVVAVEAVYCRSKKREISIRIFSRKSVVLPMYWKCERSRLIKVIELVQEKVNCVKKCKWILISTLFFSLFSFPSIMWNVEHQENFYFTFI